MKYNLQKAVAITISAGALTALAQAADKTREVKIGSMTVDGEVPRA